MAEMEKQGSALAGVTFEGNDFAALLKKEFKTKTDEAKSAVEQAVQTLAQQALANTALRSTDSVRTIEAMIAALTSGSPSRSTRSSTTRTPEARGGLARPVLPSTTPRPTSI
jgi:hypothetical protein